MEYVLIATAAIGACFLAWLLGKETSKRESAEEKAKLLQTISKHEAAINNIAAQRIREILNRPKPPATEKGIDEFLERAKKKFHDNDPDSGSNN